MRVSIIIPCYNVEEYIAECLASVEKQEHEDLEVICVDDGSTDSTVHIIEEYASKSGMRMQTVTQENNGAPSARNRGIDLCSGDYIQFLDADDLIAPHKIQSQIVLAEANGLPDVIVGSYKRIKPNGDIARNAQYSAEEDYNVWQKLMNTDLGLTSANLFKRSLFINGVRWDETLSSSQEYDLMFQILKISDKVVFDPNSATTIRERFSGSITQGNAKRKWETYIGLRTRIFDFLKENDPAQITPDLQQLLFDCLRILAPHNLEEACEVHAKYLPNGYVPHESKTTGKSYIFLYKIFGFSGAEWIRRRLRR